VRSETGHMLDRSLQLVIRAIATGALGRHGVDTADGVLEQAVQAASCIRATLPGSGVASLGRVEQTATMARSTELAVHLVASTGSATGGSHSSSRRCALLALNTHFTNRLETLGDGFIGRSLNAHCPQGYYGSLRYQDLLNQVHLIPSCGLIRSRPRYASGG